MDVKKGTPYRTKSGLKVQILSTEVKDPNGASVVALVDHKDEHQRVVKYFPNGKHYLGDEELELVELRAPKVLYTLSYILGDQDVVTTLTTEKAHKYYKEKKKLSSTPLKVTVLIDEIIDY